MRPIVQCTPSFEAWQNIHGHVNLLVACDLRIQLCPCLDVNINHVVNIIIIDVYLFQHGPITLSVPKRGNEMIWVHVWKLFNTWQTSGRKPQSREPRWLLMSKWQWHQSWSSLSHVGVRDIKVTLAVHTLCLLLGQRNLIRIRRIKSWYFFNLSLISAYPPIPSSSR